MLVLFENERLVFTSDRVGGHNQKRRTIRCSENQNNGTPKQNTDSVYDSVAYSLVKSRLSESETEAKE